MIKYKLDKMKILIVDDLPNITMVLSKYLEGKGHSCVTSNSGKEGLELIKKKKFDAVLLDLDMPEVSGFDIIDELENDVKLKDCKIIVMTAVNMTNTEIDHLYKKGMMWFLKKPLQLRELLETIETVRSTKLIPQ